MEYSPTSHHLAATLSVNFSLLYHGKGLEPMNLGGWGMVDVPMIPMA